MKTNLDETTSKHLEEMGTILAQFMFISSVFLFSNFMNPFHTNRMNDDFERQLKESPYQATTINLWNYIVDKVQAKATTRLKENVLLTPGQKEKEPTGTVE